MHAALAVFVDEAPRALLASTTPARVNMKGIGVFAVFRIMSAAAHSHGSSFLHLRRSEQQGPVASPKFMIISGSTAAEEMCLTAETDGAQAAGSGILVQPCATAIAAGDGRELFGLEDGQIVSISSRACMALSPTAAGGHDQILFDRYCCMHISRVRMCR